MVDFSKNTDDTKVLAYDLRQIYARIVGQHLADAAETRKSQDFYGWFMALQDLKTVIKHEFRKQKDMLTEYDNLIKKISETANKYTEAWKGSRVDVRAVMEINKVLRELEEFLYARIKEADMFGSKPFDEEGF